MSSICYICYICSKLIISQKNKQTENHFLQQSFQSECKNKRGKNILAFNTHLYLQQTSYMESLTKTPIKSVTAAHQIYFKLQNHISQKLLDKGATSECNCHIKAEC